MWPDRLSKDRRKSTSEPAQAWLAFCLLAASSTQGSAATVAGPIDSIQSTGSVTPGNTVPPSDPVPDQGVQPCTTPVLLESVESIAEGLRFRTSQPTSPRIANLETVREEGFSGYSTITLEIPGAALGAILPRQDWPSGPFATMRIVRYRTESECGLRIRLQPREAANWKLNPLPDGFTLTAEVRPSVQRFGADEREESAVGRAAGSLRVGGNYSLAVVEEAEQVDTAQAQLAFAQELSSLGTFRGFLSDTSPRQGEGSPFAALGLAGVVIGPTLSDFSIGDLSASFGETGLSQGGSITGLILRGAGASVLLTPQTRIQLFGGRAAESSLRRLSAGTTVGSGISRDNLIGGQFTWAYPARQLGFGIGWVRGLPEGGGHQDNFFQTAELSGGKERGLRAVLEESLSHFPERKDFGFAVTLEPKIATERLNVGGFFRYLSPEFRPPLGSNFFAGLRRSYGLFANYRPTEALSFNGSLTQSKSFSVFDPVQVGTLSSSQSLSAGYRFNRFVASSVDFSQSQVESEAGSIVPANSRTRSFGATTAFRFQDFSTSVRIGRDETVNRADPELGLESTRADLESTYPLDELTELSGRLKYAAAKRSNGESPGKDYGASAAIRRSLQEWGSLRGEIGHFITPAGVTQDDVRRSFVNLGYQTGSAIRALQGGIQVSYEYLEVASQDPRSALVLVTNLSRLFDWGPRPVPAPPFSDRALPLTQTRGEQQALARLRALVFLDENGNGVRDPSESGLRARVRVDGRRIALGTSGAQISVTEGRHVVTLDRRGETELYFVRSVEQAVEIGAKGRAEVVFGLVPGGRISGQVIFKGELSDAAVLQGIRIVAEGASVSRETVTDEEGNFRLPVLPAGSYSVKLDEASLDENTIAEAPITATVALARGVRERVSFTIRRATARERFLRRR